MESLHDSDPRVVGAYRLAAMLAATALHLDQDTEGEEPELWELVG